MLLLWQKTPPRSGLPLLFGRGSLRQGYAQLPADSAALYIAEGADGWAISGSVQLVAAGALSIAEASDTDLFTGTVLSSAIGSLAVLEGRDTVFLSGQSSGVSSMPNTAGGGYKFTPFYPGRLREELAQRRAKNAIEEAFAKAVESASQTTPEPVKSTHNTSFTATELPEPMAAKLAADLAAYEKFADDLQKATLKKMAIEDDEAFAILMIAVEA